MGIFLQNETLQNYQLWHFLSNKPAMASIKLRNKGRKNDDSLPPSYNLRNHRFAHVQPRFCIDFCFLGILIHHFTIYNWSFDWIQNFHFCSFWTPILAPLPAPCHIWTDEWTEGSNITNRVEFFRRKKLFYVSFWYRTLTI